MSSLGKKTIAHLLYAHAAASELDIFAPALIALVCEWSTDEMLAAYWADP
jgi:hypothetical protein